MPVNQYSDLIRHMEWADARLWKVLLRRSSLSADQDIRERLYHFHSTQWAFGQVLLGRPLEIPELASMPDLRSIGQWVRRFYLEITVEATGVNEAELERPLNFPWSVGPANRPGKPLTATARESLLQMILHTAHHRGQVMLRLREAGADPPLTDFIAWVWMGRPAPDWSMLETD